MRKWKRRCGWQTDPFTTEQVLQQLQLEPKVIVPSTNVFQSSNTADHNVPDLSNIGNYVECTSHEDIYLDTDLSEKVVTPTASLRSVVRTKRKDDAWEKNIEEELAKMFENEKEHISFSLKTKPDLKKKRKISKKRKNVQELLIQLFGNSLDDVTIKATSPKKIVQNRRHTLPVSINISETTFFQPLKIDQKRKSETDIDIIARDIKLASTQIIHTDYSCASDLITPKIFSDFAEITTISEEFYTAIVTEKPFLESSEKMTAASEFIDLTDDTLDHGVSVLEFDGIRVEIRTDIKPESSEQADVPVSKPSMPLLSPVSPTAPTQTEAVLPQSTLNQTTQRPPPVQKQKSLEQLGQKRKRQKILPKKSLDETRFLNLPLRQMEQMVVLPRAQVVPQEKTSLRSTFTSNQPDGGSITLTSILASEQQDKSNPNLRSTFTSKEPSRSNITLTSILTSDQPVRSTFTSTLPERNNLTLTSILPTDQQDKNNPSLRSTFTTNPIPRSTFTSEQPDKTTPLRSTFTSDQIDKPTSVLRSTFTSDQPDKTNPNLRSTQPDKNNLNYQRGQIQFPFDVNNLLERQNSTMQYVRQNNPTQTQQPTRGRQNSQPKDPPVPIHPTQHTIYGGQSRVTQPSFPATPRQPPVQILSFLLRLMKTTRTPLNFHPISNAVCADKIFPHIVNFIHYTNYVRLFETNVKGLFDEAESKTERLKFYEYWQSIVLIFGRKLLRELATVSVPNFNLSQVLVLLTTKLMESGKFFTTIKTFNYIKLMIERLEDQCTTPFLKSLYKSVKASCERMEERAGPKMTIAQLKQLETQILQYGLINKWLHNEINKQQQQQQNKSQTYQQTITEINSFFSSATRTDNAASRTSVEQTSVEASPPPPQKTVATEKRVESMEAPPVESTPPTEAAVKTETRVNLGDEIIDLTWIDDCDDKEIMEEIIECKTFPFKVESCAEEQTASREVVSPADSGLGSPVAQHTGEDYKCLCGNKAIYVCACNSSMYCSSDCQMKDWVDHQKLCHKLQS